MFWPRHRAQHPEQVTVVTSGKNSSHCAEILPGHVTFVIFRTFHMHVQVSNLAIQVTQILYRISDFHKHSHLSHLCNLCHFYFENLCHSGQLSHPSNLGHLGNLNQFRFANLCHSGQQSHPCNLGQFAFFTILDFDPHSHLSHLGKLDHFCFDNFSKAG